MKAAEQLAKKIFNFVIKKCTINIAMFIMLFIIKKIEYYK